MLKLKSLYEPPSRDDGLRIMIAPLWDSRPEKKISAMGPMERRRMERVGSFTCSTQRICQKEKDRLG
jgi:hypothetical protein